MAVGVTARRGFLEQYVGPVGDGLFIFLGVAVLLWIPYVAILYRTRGRVGARRVYAHATFALYLIIAWALVLLPLPDVGGRFCINHDVTPQLSPFAWVQDVLLEWDADGGEPLQLLANKALWVRLFNVALLIPLGVFLRRWFRRGFIATVAIGFALSLAFEVTQLTATWGLYPCPYRTFDVDDLMANTLGAAVGWAVAPAIVLLPRRRGSDDAHPEAERPTVPRRLVATTVDLLLAVGLTVPLRWAVDAAFVAYLGTAPAEGSSVALALQDVTLAVALGLLVVGVPWVAGGRSPGTWAVGLRVRRVDGGRAGLARLLARAVVLWAPILLPGPILDLLDPATTSTATGVAVGLAVLLGLPMAWIATVVVTVVVRADDRGPHDLVAGTCVQVVPRRRARRPDQPASSATADPPAPS
jgi:glycopeptide antibiotics resistance protein/uncharacterized RDD family membrane protein YckC